MAFTLDKLGSKRYNSRNTDVVRVVPQNGQEYTITPLETKLNGTPFKSWILEPENPITPDLTVLDYGLGESGAINESEAHYIAMEGMPIALHDTPRRQEAVSFKNWAMNPRLRKRLAQHAFNPLILPSQATEAVVDAAQEYAPAYAHVIDKTRSMGGLSGIMHAVHDERVETVYLEAVAGLVKGHPLPGHARGLPGIALKEIPPAVKAVMKYGPEDAVDRIMRHMGDDKLRIVREIGFLILVRPDISRCLEELKDRDVTVAAVYHEHDEFFPEKAMGETLEDLATRGLVHLVKRSPKTRHVFGIEQPKLSAQMYRNVITEARQSRTVPALAHA